MKRLVAVSCYRIFSCFWHTWLSSETEKAAPRRERDSKCVWFHVWFESNNVMNLDYEWKCFCGAAYRVKMRDDDHSISEPCRCTMISNNFITRGDGNNYCRTFTFLRIFVIDVRFRVRTSWVIECANEKHDDSKAGIQRDSPMFSNLRRATRVLELFVDWIERRRWWYKKSRGLLFSIKLSSVSNDDAQGARSETTNYSFETNLELKFVDWIESRWWWYKKRRGLLFSIKVIGDRYSGGKIGDLHHSFETNRELKSTVTNSYLWLHVFLNLCLARGCIKLFLGDRFPCMIENFRTVLPFL